MAVSAAAASAQTLKTITIRHNEGMMEEANATRDKPVTRG